MSKNTELSSVIAEHIAAVNAFDTEGVVATFARRCVRERRPPGDQWHRRHSGLGGQGDGRRPRHHGGARGHRPLWRHHCASPLRRHVRQDEPARRAGDDQLLQCPRQQDRESRPSSSISRRLSADLFGFSRLSHDQGGISKPRAHSLGLRSSDASNAPAWRPLRPSVHRRARTMLGHDSRPPAAATHCYETPRGLGGGATLGKTAPGGWCWACPDHLEGLTGLQEFRVRRGSEGYGMRYEHSLRRDGPARYFHPSASGRRPPWRSSVRARRLVVAHDQTLKEH